MNNDKKKYSSKINEFFEGLKSGDVSLLEERLFLEEVTNGFEKEKLQLLKRDVEFAISDEKLDVDFKNEEIRRNTNDEWYLSGLRAEPAEAMFTARIFRLKHIKREIEYHIQNEDKDSANKSESDPWNCIDGTARTCINNYIEDNRFTGDNDEVAKAFLTSFEIRSKQQHGKPYLGKVAPTVGKVIKHKTYPFQKNKITERQLITYLDNYWHNWRDPSKK